jgi:hypothetical protein
MPSVIAAATAAAAAAEPAAAAHVHVDVLLAASFLILSAATINDFLLGTSEEAFAGSLNMSSAALME